MKKLLLCITLIGLCLLSACGFGPGNALPENCQAGLHLWDEQPTCLDDRNHCRICLDCGAREESKPHSFHLKEDDMWESMGGHLMLCSECGYTRLEEHVYDTYSLASMTTHSATCEICQREGEVPHSFRNGACTACGLQTQITPFAEPPATIPTEPLTIETEHFTIQIDENIYVVDGVGEKFEKIYAALEAVMGITFSEQAYPLSVKGGQEKITVHVILIFN